MSSPFSLNKSPLDEETRQIALNELRETPENVANGLAELRELLANDSSIYFKDTDEYLTIFLRPCKWYAKSAYELMKRITDFKEKNKGTLNNLMPEDEKEAITEHNVVNILTNLDHKGRRVLLVHAGETWDPSKVTSDQIFRIFYLIHEVAVLELQTQVRGVVVIMDYNGMGMKQVRGLGPSFALLLLSFIQDAMPLRLKEVHMVREPFVFNMVWTLFKPLLRAKLNKRIFFHGKKMSSLHKYLAPSHLPKNYDGLLPEINYSGKEWFPVLKEHEEHIKLMNSFGKRDK
ncbi:clavesin-2-like [Diorhabda sublineata]|uniref:clavesin-2-like n=1 Tax=Diorhabda sublineata TaxID=1163346 RepID=UPI0024E0D9C8|nr:clavesin-2-like [Diorhabda sublineata]